MKKEEKAPIAKDKGAAGKSQPTSGDKASQTKTPGGKLAGTPKK